MSIPKLPLSMRYSVFLLCVLLVLTAALLPMPAGLRWTLLAVFVPLSALGVYDLIQVRHAVTRNYPVIGHVRYLVESIRPELRQYLFETDFEAVPFSRSQRSLVYARAKSELDSRPFGTQVDTYGVGYEFIGHSVRSAPPADPSGFRILIGNDQCAQPYSGSVLNVSAMSFGALSANAIMALNQGAKLGGFAQDTGEGSISPYHRRHGGDLIWQIASGYFGCRNEDGSFSAERFAAQAADAQVKMIEVKLSQGAKPGHGGILPGHKVSAEIAATRGIAVGRDCISPATHSTFATPLEMMAFIAQLRQLSGGKPVGFKLAVGQPWEFMAIVKAMLASGVVPDFVVVDGAEGGTGAAPLELSDHVGVPMREALLLVHNTLTGAGLRDKVRVGVSGKVISAFDIACALAIGADWVNSARGFMFAIGCIQSQSCHTNKCPTGVATQDQVRQRALVVPDKARRVAGWHRNTLHALAELLSSAGLTHPAGFKPHHFARRISETEIKLFSQLLPYLEPGELLSGQTSHAFYAATWRLAQAESFEAAR